MGWPFDLGFATVWMASLVAWAQHPSVRAHDARVPIDSDESAQVEASNGVELGLEPTPGA